MNKYVLFKLIKPASTHRHSFSTDDYVRINPLQVCSITRERHYSGWFGKEVMDYMQITMVNGDVWAVEGSEDSVMSALE